MCLRDTGHGCNWAYLYFILCNLIIQIYPLQIINQTTGEILGEGNWTVVYNFEGTKTFSSGCWLDIDSITIGGHYNLTVTANLKSKFGRTWTDVKTIDVALTLR